MATTLDTKFIKSNELSPAGHSFKYTAMVRHKGTIIAFAMDASQRIYYSVLNFEREGVDSALDVNFWDNEPLEVRFPDEFGTVGFRLALRQMPVITKNGEEITDGSFVEEKEKDFFLSTTARLTADAPFQVLSDGRHIFMFRQSIASGHARNITVEDDAGNDVAIVDQTLLVDRFVYVNGQLKSKLEVRFQRSRNKDIPASRKDTLGIEDLEKKPFFEPTHELDVIRNLEGGRFSVLLIPTAIPKVERWQIFAFNSATKRVDSFNIERAADGLFNTRGTRYYTSPDPTFQNDVFERKPGIDPFTGEALIPKISKEGFAEYALAFNGEKDTAVTIEPFVLADIAALEDFTLQCWLRTDGSGGSGTLISYASPDGANSFTISDPDNLLVEINGQSSAPTGISVTDSSWHLLTIAWRSESGELKIYKDDRDETADAPLSLAQDESIAAGGTLKFGNNQDGEAGFRGLFDDVRFWSRVLSLDEIREGMNHRLIGNEPELAGYWRFDEGSGTKINDQTDNANHGTYPEFEPSETPPPPVEIDESVLEANAMEFDGSTDTYVQEKTVNNFPSAEITVECWLKSDDNGNGTIFSYANTETDNAFRLQNQGDLNIRIGSKKTGATGVSFNDGQWHHLAVTWKSAGGETRIYRDGADVTPAGTSLAPSKRIAPGGSLVLGQDQDFIEGAFNPERAPEGFEESEAFEGKLYGVRVWGKALTQTEIAEIMNRQITADENGMVFQWPPDGILDLSSPWVNSDAPVGDHPGVRRSSFELDGREVAGGLSAYLYHQQENAATGYNPDKETPIKRSARLMLAMATRPQNEDDPARKPYIAALDFGLSREGKLALVPDVIALPTIQRTDASGQAASIDELLADIRTLEQEKQALVGQIERVAAEVIGYQPEFPQAPGALALSFINDDGSLNIDAIADGVTEESEEIDAEIETKLGGVPESAELTLKFDAGFRIDDNGEDGYYFFRGAECVFADAMKSAGDVKKIAEVWPGLPTTWHEGIDAVVSDGAGNIYFFKADELVKVTPKNDPENPADKWQFDDPQLISDAWPGLPEGWSSAFDATAHRGQGLVYLLKGDMYLVYDIKNASAGAPQTVASLWPLSDVWHDLELQQGNYAVVAQQVVKTRDADGDGVDDAEPPVVEDFYFFNEYEFVELNSGSAQAALLVEDATWPGLNLLFGVQTELSSDEEKVQQLLLLKDRLPDLHAVLRSIQTKNDELYGEVHLPLPFLHIDPAGLTITGGLLGFAWTEDTPLLFESVNGRINLYFRGAKDQFFVAYYDVFTGRAVFQAETDGEGSAAFVARSAGPDMDAAVVEIADGADADSCTVTLENSTMNLKEVWNKVPREARAFAETLNGLNADYRYRSNVHFFDLENNVPLPFNGANGSLLFFVSADGIRGKVKSGTVSGSNDTPASQWFADPPGNALNFSAENSYAGIPAQPDFAADNGADLPVAGDFDVDGDVSMEAWVSPFNMPPDAIAARLINQRSANSAYALGFLQIEGSKTAKAFDGTVRDYVAITEFQGFPSDALTVEFWVRSEGHGDDRKGTPISYANSDTHNAFLLFDHKNLDLHINGQNTGATGVSLLDISSDVLERIKRSYRPNPWLFNAVVDLLNNIFKRSRWHHIAVTWRSDTGEVRLYKDGVDRTPANLTLAQGETIGDGGTLVFGQEQDKPGGAFDASQALLGEMDEVRVWRVVRSEDEIRSNMNHQLTGKEAGLVAYWRFDGDEAINRASTANAGKLFGDLDLTASPVPHYNPFARVGDKLVKTEQSLPIGQWKHVAAVFNQSYALQFDGVDDYVDCGSDRTLDVSGELTLEATVRVADLEEPRGILTKGRMDDGTDEDVPYSLYIDTAGRPVFALESKAHANKLFGGSRNVFETRSISLRPFLSRKINFLAAKKIDALNTSNTYKLAVTRKKQSKTVEHKDGDGNFQSIDFLEWWDIHFYVDGALVGYVKYEGDIGGNSQPFEIGRAYDPDSKKYVYFKGDIAEVRVWGRQLEASEIAQELNGNENALISWWRFEENEGNVAEDSKSSNHGIRKGPKWVKNPDPEGSKLGLFVDGESTGAQPLAANELAALSAASEDQFTVGAALANGSPTEQFTGWLDEIRIWKAARTEEQIQDNLFRRLTGEREQLVAHYDCDAPNATLLRDQSGRGLHLPIHVAEIVLSTAPISRETSKVRDALAGIKTDFHDSTETRPGVQEYGDVQFDVEGNLIGVMKRCYAYINQGVWHLITGFKVGDLTLEWVGQAQYDPQLFGFIEGAPPVPSENLTGTSEVSGEPADYTGATAVELVDAEKIEDTYTVSEDKGIDASLEASASVGFKSDTSAGLGVATTVEDTEVKIGGKISFETSYSWLNDASVGTGKTTSQSSKMQLQGTWENPDDVAFANLGRRFVPRNLGFALVKSETADIFAMRLKETGVMVGYKMQPNPDIPPDWNIITFPLNPRYVKQGTLDGRVGLNTDPNYPSTEYSPDRSYFKPIEAYALKKSIEREEEELRNLYATFSAVGLSTDLPELEKQNMINTFVWTADGGTFVESQETTDVQQEEIGGSFFVKGMAGLIVSAEVAISKVATFFELEAMIGGHYNLTKKKSRESESSFAMNIELDGVERDIFLRDNKGNLVMDSSSDALNPVPLKEPGKVDAYRFMTFYLKPDKEHFKDFKNKVIDRIWLAQSSDPNAIALSQALEKENGVPWRIMHRVTYVSRVLPELDGKPKTVEDNLKAANIESNFELIRRLEPYVRSRTDDYTEFAEAVRDAVDNHLPELADFKDEIVNFMSLYFQVFPE